MALSGSTLGYCWSGVMSFWCLAAAILITGTAGLTNTAAVRLSAGNSSFAPRQSSGFWVSKEGSYTFGFKEVGDESYLLAIWRSQDPNKTALWWAAAENSGSRTSTTSDDPVVKGSAFFNYTRAGSLELYSSAPNASTVMLVWGSNTSSSFGELQDTGNLLLLDVQERPVWMSLEHPRDSVMVVPGLSAAMVTSKPAWLRSRRNQSSYAAGKFYLATDAQQNVEFHALDPLSGTSYVYFEGVRIMSVPGSSGSFKIGVVQAYPVGPFTYNASTNGTATGDEAGRLSLDYDGNLRAYTWSSNASSWQEVWSMMYDKCMSGSPCGPFGLCKVNVQDGAIECTCPTGYHPRVPGDISQGCSSDIPFDAGCKGSSSLKYNTTIAVLPTSDYDYFDLASYTVDNMDQCKTLCLNNCTCMAASYRGYDSQCFIKGNARLGYLLNGWSPPTNTLLIKVVTAADQGGRARGRARRWWWIVVGVPGAALVSCSTGLLLLLRRRGRRRRRRSRGEEYGAVMLSEKGGATWPVRFKYDDLVDATKAFSEVLGEGAFGKVYKGWVRAIGPSGSSEQLQAVAVKVLKGGELDEVYGGRGAGAKGAAAAREKQFVAEVSTLGKIHHVNLVSLLGYCAGGGGGEKLARTALILVYEYVENGSLDRYLSPAHSSVTPRLPWDTRYSIALGIARGLAYLHHDCSPRVVHCDIKPQNVLLGADFAAKVADFGFARRFDHRHSSHLTMSAVRGTRGYMAPEWLKSDEVTSKVDVYSFGMLLLQLVRGHSSYDDCVEWAFGCISTAAAQDQHVAVRDEEQDAAPLSSSGALERRPAVFDDDDDDDGSDCDGGFLQEPTYAKLQLLRVGLWCVQPMPPRRPPMSRVVQLIEGNIAVEDPPNPAPADVAFLPNLWDTATSSREAHNSGSLLSPR